MHPVVKGNGVYERMPLSMATNYTFPTFEQVAFLYQL